MTPPPIRYPLPTLIVLIVVVALVWRGAELARPLFSSARARWEQAVAGPPVPSSDRPRVVAGPIVRKGLLLRDDVAAAKLPGSAEVVETIRLRGFVDVYDVWPLSSEPTHVRVGNDIRAFGWIPAVDMLSWDTRLVVRARSGALEFADDSTLAGASRVEVGESPLPVVGWERDAIQVAVWNAERPWTEVARKGWLKAGTLDHEFWGVLLNRDEVLALLRRTTNENANISAGSARLAAILGRLGARPSFTPDEQRTAWAALPPIVREPGGSSAGEARERLDRLNEQWKSDASWAGLSFRFVPLSDLP